MLVTFELFHSLLQSNRIVWNSSYTVNNMFKLNDNNMGCNCEGKTINIGMGCCQPVLAPIENYYTKSQVDKLIEDIEVSGVTEEEVEEMISSATSGMATEDYVDEKDAGKLDVSAFTEYSGTVASELSGKASQGDVEVLSAQVQTIVSGEVTSAEVQTMIDQSVSGKADTSAVTSVNDALTAHTSNSDIHVTTAQTASWDAKSNFSGSYNDLTDKPTIPSIWSGTEAQWSQISGGTLDNNTIYLVY